MPGRGARGGADMRRAAAVVLLVAIAAVGLRAGGAFSAAGSRRVLGMTGHAVYWLIAVTEGVLAVAGIALLVARVIWARKSGVPLQRKRRSLWWILLLPFVTFGLALILRGRHGPALHTFAHGAVRGGTGAGHAPPPSAWPLLVTLAVGALAAGVLIAYRRRLPPPLPLAEPVPDPALEPLASAVAAGARALGEDADPRAAIIGCYAAMERSLADAGSPAEAADTPAEVLARATSGGLVRSAWAGTLTGLFRRARYGSHPMTEADRAAAMGALAGVRADLGDRS